MNEREIMIKGYETIIKKQIDTIYEYLDLNYSLVERKKSLIDLVTEIKRFIEYIEGEKKWAKYQK